MPQTGPPSGDHVPAVHSYLHVAAHSAVHPYVKSVPARQLAQETWSVPALCAAYQWPSRLAAGGTIAIVELGGGWTKADMQKYFAGIDQPMPKITDVSVDGTKNNPNQHSGDLSDPDAEVALDLEVAAASYYVATGKPATIRVYWAKDIGPAVQAASAAGCDVCSISWGADEASWGATAGNDMEQTAQQATAAGMVVFAASGDNDSSDGGPNAANVDLPASAPHVIGCGGTRKTAGSETVWNDDPGSASGQGTGGGYSTLFKPMPDWQIGAPHGPGRMVPDVAANADPVTGYEIVVHGQNQVVGGTSAVAPLYAGLFAAFGTKLGFITPTLYMNPVCFHDITVGENGAYRAGVGPDPCTGVGAPIGSRLANLFGRPPSTRRPDPVRSGAVSKADGRRRRSQSSSAARENKGRR